MTSPVFVTPCGSNLSLGGTVPFAAPVQMIAAGATGTTAVYLKGDADFGCLRTSLYAADINTPTSNAALLVETGGEGLLVSLRALDSVTGLPVAPVVAGNALKVVATLDSVTGLPVAPVVVGDALKVITSGSAPATGASINGTAAASGVIKPANALSKQVIIQCVDAAETLYVSFNNPATVTDIALQPGMSITFNAGVANDIYGLGSGAGAAFSIMELS